MSTDNGQGALSSGRVAHDAGGSQHRAVARRPAALAAGMPGAARVHVCTAPDTVLTSRGLSSYLRSARLGEGFDRPTESSKYTTRTLTP